MQYHLETIPVWDAVKEGTACPFCHLYDKNEDSQIEYTLGGSVMEPDVRIEVNATGFCQKHQQMIFERKNRLGHALMLDSHAKEIIEKLDKNESKLSRSGGKGGLFKKDDPLSDVISALDSLSQGCVVCKNIDTIMQRYLYTFVHLWKTDREFRKAIETSKGLCIPHTTALLKSAQKHLSGSARDEFASAMVKMLKEKMVSDEKDLEWFTLKFDYRNDDKPWGNSRDAVERMVNRLRGRCVGVVKNQSSSSKR